MAARIFTVVDVWNGMTSKRVYHKAVPKADAIQFLIDHRGISFDAQVVNTFLSMITET